MARRELTTKAVEHARPPKSGRLELWDSRVPGFGLRITANGVKTFAVMTRINGRQVRKTLGHWPGMELAEARQLAGRVKDAARQGRDLLDESRAEHEEAEAEAEAKRKSVKSFGDMAEDYIRREIPKLRRGGEIEAVIRRELLPRWGDRPLAEINSWDVLERIETLLDAGKPAAANKLFAVIRRLLNWAIKRRVYGLQFSPADRMDPPAEMAIRDRVLSDDEIKPVWAGSDRAGYPFGTFVKLSLILGQRRNEIAGMRWGEIDFKETLWTIPVERCKSKRPHIVPLPPSVIDLLKSLPRFAGPYVLTTTGGDRPISGHSKFKHRFDEAIKDDLEKAEMPPLDAWTLHDLRRTMRTGLARLGIADVIAERAINHAPRGLNRIYQQYEYLDERRHALNAWAAWLDDVVSPNPDKVVKLHRG